MVTSFFIVWMPLLLLMGVLLYSPFYFLYHRRGVGNWRQLTYFCLFAVGLMIIFVTLLPVDFHPTTRFLNLRPLAWLSDPYAMGMMATTKQLFINLLMFVPVTFFLAMVCPRWGIIRIMAIALVLTASIETIQYFTGRSADVDDLIVNFLGGLVGYGLFSLANRGWRSKKFWRRLLGAPTKSEELQP